MELSIIMGAIMYAGFFADYFFFCVCVLKLYIPFIVLRYNFSTSGILKDLQKMSCFYLSLFYLTLVLLAREVRKL